MSSFIKYSPAVHMAEDIIGCKWSLMVLELLRQGICRPGKMTSTVDGLTDKVLNQRLKKLVRYKIIERRSYNEIPPRVEYYLTPFGKKFIKIVDEIIALDVDFISVMDDAKTDL